MQAATAKRSPGAFYKRQDALLNKGYRRAVMLLNRQRRRLNNPRPIVSFTFDDFPASAIRIGGPILRRYDAKGTYYVSMGLMREPGAPDDYNGFTAADLRAVLAEGHEIGCHTHDHLDCALTGTEALRRDLDRNQAALNEVVPRYRMTNFAFPFGNADLASKRLLAKRFATVRGIWSGINAGTIDLGLLRAHKIYGEPANYDRALELIEENARVNGWLIFFTHDVRPSPSPFGLPPEALERMAAAARQSGAALLPVREALRIAGLADPSGDSP